MISKQKTIVLLIVVGCLFLASCTAAFIDSSETTSESKDKRDIAVSQITEGGVPIKNDHTTEAVSPTAPIVSPTEGVHATEPSSTEQSTADREDSNTGTTLLPDGDWETPIKSAENYRMLIEEANGRAILLHYEVTEQTADWHVSFVELEHVQTFFAQKDSFLSTESLGSGPFFDEFPTCWMILPDGTAFAANENPPKLIGEISSVFPDCDGMDYGMLAKFTTSSNDLQTEGTWGFVPAGISAFVKAHVS